jgi:putative transposase
MVRQDHAGNDACLRVTAMAARPPRIPGFSYLGQRRYLLTICTAQREKRFTSEALVASILVQLEHTAAEHRFEITAHSFMPDHVHLLVEGTASDSDLRRFLKIAKQRAEREARSRGVYPLWQEGYHEVVLKSWETPEAVARYVIENPVRAGLIDSRRRHPFVGTKYRVR